MDKTMKLLDNLLDSMKKDLIITKKTDGDFFSIADVELKGKRIKPYESIQINDYRIVVIKY